MSYIKKFLQDGGAMQAPATGGADIGTLAMQAVEQQDSALALQVCQMIVEMVQSQAAPEAAPAAFGKGGSIMNQIKNSEVSISKATEMMANGRKMMNANDSKTKAKGKKMYADGMKMKNKMSKGSNMSEESIIEGKGKMGNGRKMSKKMTMLLKKKKDDTIKKAKKKLVTMKEK